MPPEPPTEARIARPEVTRGRLRIDDEEVSYEQTSEGAYSHDMTYMRFATPHELAEELVRQWGATPPNRTSTHDHDDHDHHGPGHG